MTKEEIIQRVLDGAGAEFGARTAAMHINDVFNSVAGQLFARDPNQFQFYTKRITLIVSNRVATITIPLIQTSVNSRGVIRIMPTGADSDCLPDHTEFWPMPSYALRSSVDANKLSWAVFYTVTANTVRFNDSLPAKVTRLLADVAPEFQGWGNTDFIPMPAGVGQMIIDGSIAAMKGDPAYVNIFKRKS